jgi:hypothetical protein
MPTWNLTYRIGVDCTDDVPTSELDLLRNDPSCSGVTISQSFDEPNVVRIRADFYDWIGLSPQSHAILQRRSAEGVPNVAMTMPRTRVVIDISDQQEGSNLQMGSPIYIDEHGRVGSRGAPIGVVMSVDNDRHEAIVSVLGSGGGPQPFMQVTHMDGFQRLHMGTPMPTMDDLVRQAQNDFREAEDARIFEVLDAMGKEPSKPRPVFKTRYQRIMDQFEK